MRYRDFLPLISDAVRSIQPPARLFRRFTSAIASCHAAGPGHTTKYRYPSRDERSFLRPCAAGGNRLLGLVCYCQLLQLEAHMPFSEFKLVLAAAPYYPHDPHARRRLEAADAACL